MRFILICLLSMALLACATHKMSPATVSELSQAKHDFNDGYYKRAMKRLLPLASNGNAEAQYAIGYLYYYGYGVAQDKDMGYFWIERAAHEHYGPAMKALKVMKR